MKKKVLTITLLCIGITFLVLFKKANIFDVNEELSNLLFNKNEKFIQIEKYNFPDKDDPNYKELLALTNEDINKIESITSKKGIPIYKIKKGNSTYYTLQEILNISDEDRYFNNAYIYASSEYDIVVCDNNCDMIEEEVIGEIPKNQNEILITNYIADLIMSRGVKLSDNGDTFKPKSYEEILSNNYKFYNREVKITGIINYDLSKYNSFKNKKNQELTKEEVNKTYQLMKESKNIYSKIYIAQPFVDSLIKEEEPFVKTSIMYQTNSKKEFKTYLDLFKNSEFSVKTTYTEDIQITIEILKFLKIIFIIPGIILIISSLFLIKKQVFDYKKLILIVFLLTTILYLIVSKFINAAIFKGLINTFSPFKLLYKDVILIFLLSLLLTIILKTLSKIYEK